MNENYAVDISKKERSAKKILRKKDVLSELMQCTAMKKRGINIR